MEKRYKKDITVEILRVVYSLFVIWLHISISPLREDGSINILYLLIETTLYKSVIIFFLISGFFIYEKNTNIISEWLHLIKKYFLNLFLPSMVLVIICLLKDEFELIDGNIIKSIMAIDYVKVFNIFIGSLKHWDINSWPSYLKHLWYIFEYSYIVLLYPIVKVILKQKKVVVYTILIIFALFQLLNDILMMNSIFKYNYIFDYIKRPVLYSMWGYVLYNDIFVKLKLVMNNKNIGEIGIVKENFDDKVKKHIVLMEENVDNNGCKNIIKNKKILIFSILGYIIFTICICLMRYKFLFDNGIKISFIHSSWQCILPVFLSMVVVTIWYSIDFSMLVNEKMRKILLFFSKMNAGIYIVHFAIVYKFWNWQKDGYFVFDYSNKLVLFLYYVVVGFTIYLLSALIVFVVSRGVDVLIKKGIVKKEKRNK